MQDSIYKNITTTSIIAVMTVLLGFTTLFYLLYLYGSDDTTRTQIITAITGLMYFPMQYLYGQSKQRASTQSAGTTTADISATVTTTPEPENKDKP